MNYPMKDHTKNKITWQAHTVLKVNEQCLSEGKFPNGKKLTSKDIADLNEEIRACKDILVNYGCLDNQLKINLE